MNKRYTDKELLEMASDNESQWLYRLAAELVLLLREANKKLDDLIETLPE